MGEQVLVVDDDRDIARLIELHLSLEGFDVAVEHDGHAAVDRATALRPHVILLDVMMPGLDGIATCRELRENPRTAHAAIIMLTARTLAGDAASALAAGADDYITKPFDPDELSARVRAALRRTQLLVDTSPLTGLPGNGEILRRLNQRFEAGVPVAVAHADIDNFKAFNDCYGFLRGDEAIRATSLLILDAVASCGGEGGFAGHVGGDDFVVLCAPPCVEGVCRRAIAAFDAAAPGWYDAEHRAAGGVTVEDRRGGARFVPLMTLSIGVAGTTARPLRSVGEASALASEMKAVAKRVAGSAYRVDRRGS